jgi:hypothetical protein
MGDARLWSPRVVESISASNAVSDVESAVTKARPTGRSQALRTQCGTV